MSVHINEVLDYLDIHPICCHNGTIYSLMDILLDVYKMHNRIDSQELRQLQHTLQHYIGTLPDADSKQVFRILSQLCMEHEQLAFSHGIVVGMHLMSEVNMLP